MQLSMRIRIARQRAKLSQEALARLLGVSRGAVANWECAVGSLPATTRLELLAQATGVCFEWLATGRGPITYTEPIPRPSTEGEWIDDPIERRLVQAYRVASRPLQRMLLRLAEAQLQDPDERRRA